MKIILLSGGSGRRLWPLSNDVRSKQFLKLLPTPDGEKESMIQRTVRQISEAGLADSITVATSASQSDIIRNQLGAKIDIVLEPERRDTFPAIALACSHLYYQANCQEDEVIVVIPCDSFTEPHYFDVIAQMAGEIARGTADLMLMGIVPSSPSTKFGYILPDADDYRKPIMRVDRFVEKPDSKEARRLISSGALWNGGVFAFRLGYMKQFVAKYIKSENYKEFYDNYGKLPKISFDYEVVEKAESVSVATFDGFWKDLGTWDALSEELPTTTAGKVILADNVRNTHVINELDVPLLCAGTDGLIVISSLDGILVANKKSTEHIKEQMEALSARPMYEERRWGYYKVIGRTEYPDGHRSLTKLLHLNAGCSISYQTHSHREEIWTFVDGEGLLVLDDEVIPVSRGYVAHIKVGQKHAVKAITDLEIIEVQAGAPLIEDDIERFDWVWEK